ncbi:MAG: cyclic nucleotide-binding domain-containing protein [Chitinophagales bacterium]|nr:cyclic nucleotide-binding domain-containing protein [Bacteroidota bacterium]MBK8486392.1 cyclic nucleotide-binding domain-containing protein [Bacteroidota bacterium]MBK8683172.1 cyclic nucleotide-binding domain-containing protein [Bacteroidota bacterium]
MSNKESTSNNSKGKLLLLEKVLILKATNVFSQTPENILADVVSLLEEIEFEENTEIFKEGDIGDAMYIIHRGNVRITKGKVILAILKENDVFGELSLLDAETRSASAFANTDCTIFKIEQQAFYELIESRPEIIRGIVKILCSRLRKINQMTADQATAQETKP